jgi:hypothetical protein
MNKLLAVLSIICISKFSFSQDTIVLISNQVVIAKISEINSTEIKYKRFDMQDGPDFIEKKSKIKMIRYKNGTVDNFITEKTVAGNSPVSSTLGYPFVPFGKKKYTYNGRIIGENRMYKIMGQENNPEINLLMKKAKVAKGIQFVGFGAIATGVYSVYSFIFAAIFANSDFVGTGDSSVSDFYRAAGIASAVATVGLGTTGIVFSKRHTNLKAKAVKLYNQKF